MKDPIYEKLMAYLKSTHLPLYQVAQEANIGQATISRISNGKCKNPRIQTVQALIDFFERPSAVPLVNTGGDVAVTNAATKVSDDQENNSDRQAGKQDASPGIPRKWDAVRARALAKKADGQPENA